MNQTNLKVYGADWCHYTTAVREFLSKEKIDFDYLNIDEDSEAEEFVYKVNNDSTRTIPVVVFPDGVAKVNPSVEEIREKVDKD